MTPSGVFAEPQEIAVLIGNLSRDADWVAVEVVDLVLAFAFFVYPVVFLYQRFVAVGIGVDIGIPSVRVDFLQQTATVPSEVGLIFEVV